MKDILSYWIRPGLEPDIYFPTITSYKMKCVLPFCVTSLLYKTFISNSKLQDWLTRTVKTFGQKNFPLLDWILRSYVDQEP